MRKGKISLAGIIIVLLLVLFVGGFAAFGATIKSFAIGIWEVVKWLVALAIRFPEDLGITDFFKTWILFLAIAVICSALGIVLTKRGKKKILGICSFVVSAISLILTFCAI